MQACTSQPPTSTICSWSLSPSTSSYSPSLVQLCSIESTLLRLWFSLAHLHQFCAMHNRNLVEHEAGRLGGKLGDNIDNGNAIHRQRHAEFEPGAQQSTKIGVQKYGLYAIQLNYTVPSGCFCRMTVWWIHYKWPAAWWGIPHTVTPSRSETQHTGSNALCCSVCHNALQRLQAVSNND